MKKQVLISGASFAGLTLAYWLNKFGFQVTLVEIGKELRKGGSPIDVRGDALKVVQEMGIYDRIKAKEFAHSNDIVDANDQTLVSFSLNDRTEYLGDIEIHRGDLLEILYDLIPKNEVQIEFQNSIETLTQYDDYVSIGFKNGKTHNYDFVIGADRTHSAVRRLVFGKEEHFSKFFNAYFAFAEAKNIQTNRSKNTAVIYRKVGKQAALYPFKNTVNAVLMFASPKLNWDHRNMEANKQILKEDFGNNPHWKIPTILDDMLQSDDLYFDEVCQIHMDTWTKGRVALVGDAAHAPSFFTGMGTSLAMQGATILAKELAANDDFTRAFANYNHTFKPIADDIQSRINRGLKVQLPTTEADLQSSIERFKTLE